MRGELRHGPATLDEHDLLALTDAFKQVGKACFGGFDVHASHATTVSRCRRAVYSAHMAIGV
jgi:hypothetical protein